MKILDKAEYGICRLSVAGIWKHALVDSPMISQALFGETVQIINIKNSRWVRVLCIWDQLIGWMDPKHLHFFDQKKFDKLPQEKHLNLELMYGIQSDEISIPITIGAELHKFDGINVKMPFGKFRYSGQVFSVENSLLNESLLVKLCYRFLNAPQMRGGRSILGLEADSFVQLMFKFMGIFLPRYAVEQCKLGSDVGFISDSKIGDVAYFAQSNNQISHVGIIIGDEKIIHVHGRVKIDRIDQQGIYDLELKKYTYQLRTLRRLVQL